MEDAFQHEQIQKGLASRARSHMIMQDEEIRSGIFTESLNAKWREFEHGRVT